VSITDIRREAWTATSIAGYVVRRRIIPAPELNQMRVAIGMHTEEAKKQKTFLARPNLFSLLHDPETCIS